MQRSISNWTIENIYNIRSSIHEQPKYQRGEVWSKKKQQLLIDSILRGIDIPKVYLRKLEHGLFDFEVADGQQRLTAIFNFKNNKLPLSTEVINGLDLSKFGRYRLGGKYYKDLNIILKTKFDQFELTIALIEDASNAEIRTLFGRLQMGDPLNPAEIRNAIISQLGTEIDNIALNHNFFDNCKINSSRYKYQDYLTHLFALLHYNNRKSLKAPILLELYFDLSKVVPNSYMSTTVSILEHMYQIDLNSNRRIANKWAFVDFFWFLFNNVSKSKTIDYPNIAQKFDEFERDRMANNRRPENLIQVETPSVYNVNLYNYIVAFNTDGGSPSNINKRLRTFESLFQQFLNN